MTDVFRREFDVVVVGGGGSGLAAAVSAAEHGAQVAVLEKRPELGGTTALAVGSFTASETAYQQRAGVEDAVAAHIEDAAKFAPPEIEARNNEELRAFLLRHAGDTLAWLTNMGLAFYGPTPEPPNRAMRMHNVVPGARAYVLSLQRRLQKLNGAVFMNAPVTKLVRENGRVTGAVADLDGHPHEFAARQGVVLAAGDYASAPDIITQHKGPEFAAVEGINPHATGDGHRLCEAVGAKLINMDVTYGPELRFAPPGRLSLLRRLPASGWIRTLMGALMPYVPRPMMNAIIKRELVTWQHPEDSLFDDGAVLVNAEGRRFCNEKDSPAREIAIARQPGKCAYILLDKRLVARYSDWPHFVSTAPEIAYAYVKDYLNLRPDVAIAESSLEAIAQARGLPPDALEDAVTGFNRYVVGEAPDPFGRTGDTEPLREDDWVLLGPAKAYFTITEGSPAINLEMQVLDETGTPIPGLYAVGQNGMGGQVLWGHGLHIAWAITSGRLVGHALANGAAATETRDGSQSD
ncbi:MAG: FAD-dependent oxidoreductase [Candidatus Hydrogenedentota bacterium]